MTDKHIDAVNRLVAQELCTDTQTTLLQQSTVGFQPVETEVIQIVHNDNHWVLTGLIGNDVILGDSIAHNISERVATQIKQLYSRKISNNKLTVRVIPCDKQNNDADCGVFACALAMDLALERSIEKADRMYDKDVMRRHLLLCLEEQQIRQFPGCARK